MPSITCSNKTCKPWPTRSAWKSASPIIPPIAPNTTRLKAFVHIIDKVYQTGRKVADDFKQTMRIVFDEVLPQWNYRAVPLSQPSGKVI